MKKNFPAINASKVPVLTTTQMVEVDRAMVQDFHIELTQMMENTGRNLAQLARCRFLDGNPSGKQVVVLAGSGGNGGGALVSARRLHNWGAEIVVYLTKSGKMYKDVPARQLDILQQMEVPIRSAEDVNRAGNCDLIIDGIIGYSLKGTPGGNVADLINWANLQKAPKLSLDVPSGLDATSGALLPPAILATATMTLALPKHGLLLSQNMKQVGELYLADISIPPSLYTSLNLDKKTEAIFAQDDIVRLENNPGS